MNSMLWREVRWLGTNIAIAVVYLYIVAIGQAIVLLLVSGDGSVAAGWSGAPIGQVLGWAMFSGSIAVFLSPLIAAVLLLYRIVVHLVGHPRAIGFLFAAATGTVLSLVLPQGEPSTLTVVGLVILGYAALVRSPGQTLAGLPAWLRGGVIGLALSQVWIAGSILGMGWAGYRSARGARLEAGAIAIGATLIPGMVLFADLFRDGVPEVNYVITTVLIGGVAFGLLQLVFSGPTQAPRDEPV